MNFGTTRGALELLVELLVQLLLVVLGLLLLVLLLLLLRDDLQRQAGDGAVVLLLAVGLEHDELGPVIVRVEVRGWTAAEGDAGVRGLDLVLHVVAC